MHVFVFEYYLTLHTYSYSYCRYSTTTTVVAVLLRTSYTNAAETACFVLPVAPPGERSDILSLRFGAFRFPSSLCVFVSRNGHVRECSALFVVFRTLFIALACHGQPKCGPYQAATPTRRLGEHHTLYSVFSVSHLSDLTRRKIASASAASVSAGAVQAPLCQLAP